MATIKTRTINAIATKVSEKVSAILVPYVQSSLESECKLHEVEPPTITTHTTNRRIRLDVNGKPYLSVNVESRNIFKAISASAIADDARASLDDESTWMGKVKMIGFANKPVGRVTKA
jgi:hypothetical protein